MPVQPIKSFSEYQKIINSPKPVLIDFWATWCGPCRFISPIFEKLSASSGNGIEFYKVDVDDQEDIARAAGITAMPTFILFKHGQKQGDLVGAAPRALESLVVKAKSLALDAY